MGCGVWMFVINIPQRKESRQGQRIRRISASMDLNRTRIEDAPTVQDVQSYSMHTGGTKVIH